MDRKGVVLLLLLTIIKRTAPGNRAPGTSTQVRNSFISKEPTCDLPKASPDGG